MKPKPCGQCMGTGVEQDQAALSRQSKEYREKAGLLQKQVALAMGITPAYLSDLEANRRDWNLDLWNRMLKACGVKS